MLIRSATIRDFAILRGPIRARFLPGLNIIHGPNESGKSTLLEAIWSGLTLRSRVTGQRLERITPRGGGTPCVELLFEHGGRSFAVVKVFNGLRGETRLIINDGNETTKLADEEAESTLRTSLGLGERAGMSRSGDGHLGIWPLLWVRQGKSSVEPSEALVEGGRSSLGDRLADLAGEVLAGTGSEAVYSAVQSEYLRFFTEKKGVDRGGATSILASGNSLVGEARERLEELEDRQRQYRADVDRFVEIAEELRRIQDGLQSQVELVHRLEEHATKARTVIERRNTAKAVLETATVRRDQTKQRVEQGRADETTLETTKRRLLEIDARIEAGRKALSQHEADREERAGVLAQQRSEVEQASRRARRLRIHVELSGCRGRLADAEKRVAAADEHRQRTENLQSRIDDLPLNAPAFSELERLHHQQEQASTLVHAASASIRITAKKELALKVGRRRIDLKPGEQWSDRSEEPVSVVIDDVAEVEVIPGDLEVGNLRNQAAAAEKAIRKRLRELNLKSVGQARRVNEARRRFETQLQDEKRLLELVEGSQGAVTDVDLSVWRDQAVALEEELRQVGDCEKEALPSDSRGLLALQAETERALEQARTAVEQAQAHLAAHGTERERLLGRISVSETDRQAVVSQIGEIESRLAETSSDAPALPTLLEQDEARCTEARHTIETIETELAVLGGDEAERNLNAAKEELARCQDELAARKQERDHLEGRLTAANLLGLHDQVAAARAGLERAEATYEPIFRRAQAVKLLYETLNECRNSARQSVVQPLQRAVEPLVKTVFGAASVSFDQHFAVEKIRREDTHDTFDQLSGGAKEQLALLVRLGMARVLAGDQPLTVMLDDAIVATDPARFSRMVDVLHDVADPLQILLFTCQWERYRAVASDRLNGIDLEQLKQEP